MQSDKTKAECRYSDSQRIESEREVLYRPLKSALHHLRYTELNSKRLKNICLHNAKKLFMLLSSQLYHHV